MVVVVMPPRCYWPINQIIISSNTTTSSNGMTVIEGMKMVNKHSGFLSKGIIKSLMGGHSPCWYPLYMHSVSLWQCQLSHLCCGGRSSLLRCAWMKRSRIMRCTNLKVIPEVSRGNQKVNNGRPPHQVVAWYRVERYGYLEVPKIHTTKYPSQSLSLQQQL